MERLRRISSIILLAVFLPAFVASVIHKHPEEVHFQEECVQCYHHLPHQGHIGQYKGGISDCILCHFLGLPFIASLVAVILSPAMLGKTLYFFPRIVRIGVYLRTLHPRAPPVFSFA